MRYLFLILIISNFSFAQNIHKAESYKFNNYEFKNYDLKNNNRILSNSVIVTPVNTNTPISNFITDIILNGDTVWFATGSGIMRTINFFDSFQSYAGLAPFGNDDVAGFNLNKNVIVTATAISQEINGESIPVGTGIKVSTDYGANWTAYPQPLDLLTDTIVIYGTNNLRALPIVVPQQNLSYDIAITKTQNDPGNYTIWICSFAGGLRKITVDSLYNGRPWQRVVLPPDNLDSVNIEVTGYTFIVSPRDNNQGGSLNYRVFSITAVNDSTLYVGTANGINKSTSWGVNWTKYNFQNTDSLATGNGISGNFVVNLDVQKYSGKEIIWGATNQTTGLGEYDAFSYSSNGGANWFSTLNNFNTNGMSFKDSIVYGFTDEGLWRSVFGTTFNWATPSVIYDERTKDKLRTTLFYAGNHIGDTLYFGSADGLLRTIEYGQPWIGKWTIYREISPIDLSSDIKTYAAPNPFSPDDEITRIYYKSTTDVSKITINIYDFGMNPVRTVIQNATRTGTDVLFTAWDGTNDNGVQAANGVYFYRVEFDGENPVWGKIILLQ